MISQNLTYLFTYLLTYLLTSFHQQTVGHAGSQAHDQQRAVTPTKA